MDHSRVFQSILTKRGVQKEKLEEFLNPPHPSSLSLKGVGVDTRSVDSLGKILSDTKKSETPIVIYGDYDADGITATAILLETLTSNGFKVVPFIPTREDHGYGLSKRGIDEIITSAKPRLIIAVDNGVTSIEATRYAQEQGIQIAIVDHHQKSKIKHPADTLVHSTKVAGSGLTWLLVHELCKRKVLEHRPTNILELAAIGTVTDLVPLTGPNRMIVRHGLTELRSSSRVGIKALLKEARIRQDVLDTYHLGFQIGPRLNATGRLSHAMDSLRLLCTKNPTRAKTLAETLAKANQKRQQLTEEMTVRAFRIAKATPHPAAIIVCDEMFHEGIIGLVAGKLVQAFWQPAIVIAKKSHLSKASARSIPGFNIIEAIRKLDPLLVNAGGHPMAAGFTIKTELIDQFSRAFERSTQKMLSPTVLNRKLNIDTTSEFSELTDSLYEELSLLSPFGVGNPKPLLLSKRVHVISASKVGSQGKHLRLLLEQKNQRFPAVAFGKGELVNTVSRENEMDVVFHLERNTWNNRSALELVVKEISTHAPESHGLDSGAPHCEKCP